MATVAWDGAQLELRTYSSGTERTVARFDFEGPPDARYDVTLRRGSLGGWWLRAPLAGGSLFGRADAETSELIPPPDQASLAAPDRGRIHENDVLTVIGDAGLHVRMPAAGRWRTEPLPETMRVDDVSFDRDGGLWTAGSVRSKRLPGATTEAAIRYRANGSASFDPRSPRLGIADLARVIRRGGLERIRTIDAEERPIIATSDSPGLLDNPSSFVFVQRNRDKWAATTLEGRLARQVVRSGTEALVITTKGGVHEVAGNGRLVELTRGAELRSLFAEDLQRSEARMTVRGACAGTGVIAVAVGLSAVDQEKLYWMVTALCTSEDRGRTWTLVERTEPVLGDPELLTVAA